MLLLPAWLAWAAQHLCCNGLGFPPSQAPRSRLKWMVDAKGSEQGPWKETNSNFPSSHNHGSVKNGCISNRIVTFQIIAIFHWTMVIGERVWNPKAKATILTSILQVVIIIIIIIIIRAKHIMPPAPIHLFFWGCQPFCNMVLFVKSLNNKYIILSNLISWYKVVVVVVVVVPFSPDHVSDSIHHDLYKNTRHLCCISAACP